MVFFQVFLGQPLFGREFIKEHICTGLMVFFWSTWLFLKQRLPYSVFTLSLQDLLLLFLVPYEHPGKLKFGLFNPATAYNSHFHMIDSLEDSCAETSSSCLTVIKERIVFKFFKHSQKTKDHHINVPKLICRIVMVSMSQCTLICVNKSKEQSGLFMAMSPDLNLCNNIYCKNLVLYLF